MMLFNSKTKKIKYFLAAFACFVSYEINISFPFYRKFGIIVGWVIFALLAYKVSTVELDFKEYDPYAELGIDRVRTSFPLFIQE